MATKQFQNWSPTALTKLEYGGQKRNLETPSAQVVDCTLGTLIGRASGTFGWGSNEETEN